MEEAKAYIESGKLELYVLGQLTAEEQLEVEEMSKRYPAVKEEINAIEIALEQYAMEHAIQPTSGLEQRIFAQISGASEIPVTPEPVVKQEAVVVPLYPDHTGTVRTLRFALAACAVLLVVSVFSLYSAHSKLAIANDQIVALNQSKEKFAATVSFMKDENEDLQQIAAMSADPTWTTVKLAGTKIAPEANMVVYWHKKGQHVMVDNTRMALPQNDEGHQYQLWALVNGKPVDLGVFDAKAEPKKLLVAMKEIGTAQAFAVTLEKRGGSINPTMEKLVAMGGVSI